MTHHVQLRDVCACQKTPVITAVTNSLGVWCNTKWSPISCRQTKMQEWREGSDISGTMSRGRGAAGEAVTGAVKTLMNVRPSTQRVVGLLDRGENKAYLDEWKTPAKAIQPQPPKQSLMAELGISGVVQQVELSCQLCTRHCNTDGSKKMSHLTIIAKSACIRDRNPHYYKCFLGKEKFNTFWLHIQTNTLQRGISINFVTHCESFLSLWRYAQRIGVGYTIAGCAILT